MKTTLIKFLGVIVIISQTFFVNARNYEYAGTWLNENNITQDTKSTQTNEVSILAVDVIIYDNIMGNDPNKYAPHKVSLKESSLEKYAKEQIKDMTVDKFTSANSSTTPFTQSPNAFIFIASFLLCTIIVNLNFL